MERPLSAASSGTAPSTTSGPTYQQQHRRHASSIKNGVRPAGSSTVALFVTNLRLLDLDLHPHWPNITVSSFSYQDARTRIKCSEHALYQLFRLYDPGTTTDKLQPFFPPLEPLQSVNLRAALYRCLNDLKKSGVLAKETVLRKTMLDECNGEKFWEVCLNFSTIVLRRYMAEKQRSSRTRSKHEQSIAEQLATAQSVSKSQKESMLPLAIAHRASLAKVLEQKRRKQETFGRLHNLLTEKQDELSRRKANAEQSARNSRQTRPEKLRAVETAVEKSWIGSTDLKDALIEGDTCAKGDGLLVQSFDYLWNENDDGQRRDSGGAEIGLLQSLNDKAAEQSVRLRRWQHFHDRLISSKPASSRSSRPASQPQRPGHGISFNKHRDINLHEVPEEDDEPPRQQRPHLRNDSATRYDDILTAMREELRMNSTAHRNRPIASPIQPSFHGAVRRSQTQPIAPVRKLSVAIDTAMGAQSPHVRSPSQTTVPLRSPMGRRVSSRSRSYDKPKVDGMREPIPLKAELFSPLRENRRSSLGANSMLSSPAEAPELDNGGVIAKVGKVGATEDQENGVRDHEIEVKSPASPRDSGLGMKTDGFGKDVVGGADSSDSRSGSDVEAKSATPLAMKLNARPSLAERTRKSMAFTSTDDIRDGDASDSPPEVPAGLDHDEAGQETDSPAADLTQFDRRASLLDRTRQSISLAPPPGSAAQSKKTSHNRSRTSIYPINQFETPKKTRRSTIGNRERRDVTPMEKLMSPDAEYNSVFKSRPKIALSPVLSPCRDEFDLDAQLGTPSAVRLGADKS